MSPEEEVIALRKKVRELSDYIFARGKDYGALLMKARRLKAAVQSHDIKCDEVKAAMDAIE